jgi:hypothetical protein
MPRRASDMTWGISAICGCEADPATDRAEAALQPAAIDVATQVR